MYVKKWLYSKIMKKKVAPLWELLIVVLDNLESWHWNCIAFALRLFRL